MLHSGAKKIKPCPFCGGKALPMVRKRHHPYCYGVMDVFVECRTCHSRGPSFNDFRNDDSVLTMSNKAINAWNERVKNDSRTVN